MTQAHDTESILIGSILRFGRDAALCVLPQLTSEKFVHDFAGLLGGEENRHIWSAIEYVTLVDKADPQISTGALRLRLDEKLMPLAEAYANELTYKYRIDQYDPDTLRSYAREIHRNGIVWNVIKISERFALLKDPDLFNGYVAKIEDPDTWMAQVLSNLHASGVGEGEDRYLPIQDVVEDSKIKFDQQMRGEQIYLLPVGVPLLYAAGLFPAETMALVHGISSGGKSTFVQNVVNLGTAIGLVHNNVQGCVAINSLEMDKHLFVSRAAASLAGFNTFTLATRPQEVKADDYARFMEYVDFVGKLPIWIDDTPHISIETLMLRLTGVHLGHAGPVRQLSTDYLELFEDSGDEKNNEQQLSKLAARHFEIKRTLHTCVIAVSQTTYNSKTFVGGMYGARYSKALTHKPDIILEVINYNALKKSGTDYVIAEGLDDENFWLILQKYRGGPTDVKMKWGWEPEYTRLYDPALMGIDAKPVIFEHMEEVRYLLKKHPTTTVIPIKDTPLGGDF